MSTLNPQGTVAAILEVARRNLGFVEGTRNSNIYASVAGHANNQPWCATFLVACARRAGVKLGSESAYTPNMHASMAKVAFANVRPGDIMFLYFPTLGRIAHCGIVESKGSNYVITIEGNTNAAGSRSGGQVMRRKRFNTNLRFTRPVYKTVAPAPKPVVADPILRLGSRGQIVLNLQKALVRHGARGLALDSDFGPATKKAVIAFQTRKKLVADGVVGPATWAALRTAP